ncbi:hypothetical protein BC832DRAFT_590041 [Gaertneriomyces semiglobifer]|nr:hypothetical protein BC832DRAFT_590041 [Gaertneriomyces semiglobifer]
MKMLNPEEEREAEVTWEDQRNINSFSLLNARMTNLESTYAEKSKEKEYLDDLTGELELADEDEPVKYKIGDSFVTLTLEECMKRIEDEREALDRDMEGLSEKMSGVQDKMGELKVLLKTKFGDSINLDR